MLPLVRAIEELVPSADFYGSLTDEDQASYDALTWNDARAKPAWAAVEARRNRGPTPDELRAYAADRRYAAETAGVTGQVGGVDVPVSTRREDRDGLRDTMSAILVGLRADGATFKFADGITRPASNAEMKAVVAEAFTHVQAAFDREGEVVAGILAAPPTVTTRAQIDAAFEALQPAA